MAPGRRNVFDASPSRLAQALQAAADPRLALARQAILAHGGEKLGRAVLKPHSPLPEAKPKKPEASARASAGPKVSKPTRAKLTPAASKAPSQPAKPSKPSKATSSLAGKAKPALTARTPGEPAKQPTRAARVAQGSAKQGASEQEDSEYYSYSESEHGVPLASLASDAKASHSAGKAKEPASRRPTATAKAKVSAKERVKESVKALARESVKAPAKAPASEYSEYSESEAESDATAESEAEAETPVVSPGSKEARLLLLSRGRPSIPPPCGQEAEVVAQLPADLVERLRHKKDPPLRKAGKVLDSDSDTGNEVDRTPEPIRDRTMSPAGAKPDGEETSHKTKGTNQAPSATHRSRVSKRSHEGKRRHRSSITKPERNSEEDAVAKPTHHRKRKSKHKFEQCIAETREDEAKAAHDAKQKLTEAAEATCSEGGDKDEPTAEQNVLTGTEDAESANNDEDDLEEKAKAVSNGDKTPVAGTPKPEEDEPQQNRSGDKGKAQIDQKMQTGTDDAESANDDVVENEKCQMRSKRDHIPAAGSPKPAEEEPQRNVPTGTEDADSENDHNADEGGEESEMRSKQGNTPAAGSPKPAEERLQHKRNGDKGEAQIDQKIQAGTDDAESANDDVDEEDEKCQIRSKRNVAPAVGSPELAQEEPQYKRRRGQGEAKSERNVQTGTPECTEDAESANNDVNEGEDEKSKTQLKHDRTPAAGIPEPDEEEPHRKRRCSEGKAKTEQTVQKSNRPGMQSQAAGTADADNGKHDMDEGKEKSKTRSKHSGKHMDGKVDVEKSRCDRRRKADKKTSDEKHSKRRRRKDSMRGSRGRDSQSGAQDADEKKRSNTREPSAVTDPGVAEDQVRLPFSKLAERKGRGNADNSRFRGDRPKPSLVPRSTASRPAKMEAVASKKSGRDRSKKRSRDRGKKRSHDKSRRHSHARSRRRSRDRSKKRSRDRSKKRSRDRRRSPGKKRSHSRKKSPPEATSQKTAFQKQDMKSEAEGAKKDSASRAREEEAADQTQAEACEDSVTDQAQVEGQEAAGADQVQGEDCEHSGTEVVPTSRSGSVEADYAEASAPLIS